MYVNVNILACTYIHTYIHTCIHTYIGGTGSGLGARLTEELSDVMTDLTRINIAIAPYHIGVRHPNLT